jgi:oligoendopeptidase F
MAFLPYGVLGDHFQHEVYENPGSGAAARHDMWRKLEHHYQPSLDWGDLDYAAKGGRWQMQGHFFGMPFYYIDYTLALTCALQMWLLSRNDKAGTFERYHTLCGLGGSRPFQELVASAGLTSPFADGCLTDVVREVRSVLFPS